MTRPKRARTWVLIGVLVCALVPAVIFGPNLIYHAILWVWTGQTRDISLTPPREIALVPQGAGLQTLRGHKGPTTALAFFPDGRRLASGGEDHLVRIWDLDRHTSRDFEGHQESIYALAVSGDGRRILSGGADLVVRLWDVASGNVIALLEGHTAAVRAVAFLPNDRAITAGDDGTLRLWDLRSEQQLKEIEAHANAVQGMSVSSDGTRAASIDADGVVCVWDLTRSELAWKFRLSADSEPTAGPIMPNVPASLAFSADGKKLWALFGRQEAATVSGWDVATRKPLAGWESNPRAEFVKLSADGQHLLIVIQDEANVYGAGSGAQAEYQARLTQPVAPPQISPQQFQALATQPAGAGKEPPEAVRKFMADTLREIQTAPHPYAAAISADGNRVAVGMRRGFPLGPAQPSNGQTPLPGEIVVFDRPH